MSTPTEKQYKDSTKAIVAAAFQFAEEKGAEGWTRENATISLDSTTRLTRLLDELTGDDRETISGLISMLKDEEWLEDEIYNYCRLTEEVNPDLPEYAALQQMTFIAQKVRNRKEHSQTEGKAQ